MDNRTNHELADGPEQMSKIRKLQAGLPLSGGTTYTNPLTVEESNLAENVNALVNPDPYVMKYNGEYYCFATGQFGVPVLHSRDLVHWNHLGFAISDEDQRHYWAPAVVYHNGLFYMYYSSIYSDQTDVHMEYMKVAVSKTPQGPYIYQKTMFDTFSIDAHVVKDVSGEFYLFYSTNITHGTDGQRPGTVILVDRLIDMTTPEGKPQLVVKPTIDEEIYEENRFGDGRDWHTIEGAFYLTKRDKAYVMYSGNAFTRPTYFIGYSTAHIGKGTPIDRLIWSKFPDDHTYRPLLRKNAHVEGVGHHSVVKAPNNVDDWVIYHGRNARAERDTHLEQRQMRMDPLLWIGDRMWVPGPSFEVQSAPGMPQFRDLFDGEGEAKGTLSTEWLVTDGEWTVEGGEAAQNRLEGIGSAVTQRKFDHYIYEVNVCWEPSHMGGRYGVYACYQDERNHAAVLLDAGARKVAMYPVIGGVKGAEHSAELERDFNFAAYHQLRIHKVGGLLKVYVDDLLKLSAVIDVADGSVGMVTYFTKARFDGASVTRHVELDADTQDQFMKYMEVGDRDMLATDDWVVDKGTLRCGRSRGRSQDESNSVLWLKESLFAGAWRFSADISVEDSRGEGMIGLYPYYAHDHHYVAVKLDRASNTLDVETCNDAGASGKSAAETVSCKLPEDFDFGETHTLMVVKSTVNLTVFLDDYLVYTGDWAVSGVNHRVGLFSSLQCKFSAIQITQL
jgi:GH43 family beta-xylosidase